MNKLKETYLRFFKEKTTEFHQWLRNAWILISGSSGVIMDTVDKHPNAYDPWVSKVCGILLIGGIFGAITAQTASKQRSDNQPQQQVVMEEQPDVPAQS
jgi:hypothetical protein